MKKNTNKHESPTIFSLKDWLNFEAKLSFDVGRSKDETLSNCIVRNNKDKNPLKESDVVDIVTNRYKELSTVS